MKNTIRREIALDQGVTATLHGSVLTLKGPRGEVIQDFTHPKVTVAVEGTKVVLTASRGTKKEKTMVGSFESHILNSVKGVQEPHLYKLKICSGHFPMSVAVSGAEFVIKNFLGESVPRKVGILPGSTVEVKEKDITVTSPDKDIAGQMAARIESLCRITQRDRRIFQDGCYIIHKAGKDI